MCKNRVIYGLLNTSWVLINMAPRSRVFAENFGWVAFLVSVSYVKQLLTHEKAFAVVKKVAQMPLLT